MIRTGAVFSIGVLGLAAPALAHGHLEPGAALRLAAANPAAVFCIDSGGSYEIRATSGGETGICILPDGREKDAWEHFRANKS